MIGEVYPPGTVIHPDGTIDAQACHDCGVQTFSILEIANAAGEVVAARFVCRTCQSKLRSELAELRAIFEGYLADGMNRAQANEAMLRLHVNQGAARARRTD